MKAKLEALKNAKNSNNEYEVEAIIGKRTTKSKKTGTVKTKYLIRWKGWGEEGIKDKIKNFDMIFYF